MKKYIVKFENREMWNTEEDIHDESQWIVSEEDISRLAIEWGKDIAELMEQVEEKEETKMKYEELKEEYERLHEELVESYAITNDCGWTQEMENELYLAHASSYHRQYLYDDDPDFVEDLEELIRRVKEKIEDNKKYLPQ